MKITKEDRALFQRACKTIVEKERLRQGIGTLGEKTIHAVLKHYLVPFEEYHEIRCDGFVADILMQGEITEIQTAHFDKLRKKLDIFLEKYEVTVVYPVPAKKWLFWIDEETGEITKKRKSPKTGTIYEIGKELYKIKTYLKNPHLHFRILLIDMEEYRLLNGWSENKKRGSVRFDRIPIALEDDFMISTQEDYKNLIPAVLPQEFTSKEYGKETRLTLAQAQKALLVLTDTEAVKRIGKRGNSILYCR